MVADDWMTRDPSEQERITSLALASWLPAVTTFSPFWKERAQLVGADPQDLTSRKDLERFAPVTEDEIRDVGGPGGPALVMRPNQQQVKARADSSLVMKLASSIRSEGAEGQRRLLLEEYKPIRVARGGAAGALAIASTRSDLDRRHRVGARCARVLGLEDGDVIVSAIAPDDRGVRQAVRQLALGASLLALHPRTGPDDLDAVVDAIRLTPPSVLVATPEDAMVLAATLAEGDVDVSGVRTVVLVGPPPTDEDRLLAREAFLAAGTADDTVVRALFVNVDGRTMWAEPRTAPVGLVTHPDLEVVEVVDAVTGRPSSTSGDLTVTTLGWHGTALLRYQTGWFATGIDTDPCPQTGITAPRLRGPFVERAWQPLVDVGGGATFPLDFRAGGRLFEERADVDGWRIELRGPTKKIRQDRILVEVGGEHDAEVLELLQHEFEIRAGVLPTGIRSVAPSELKATVSDVGSPFADGR